VPAQAPSVKEGRHHPVDKLTRQPIHTTAARQLPADGDTAAHRSLGNSHALISKNGDVDVNVLRGDARWLQ
jgi:hypothetical protein